MICKVSDLRHKEIINSRDGCRLGYADDVERRLDQLNRSECIPFAFRVYATYEVQSRLSDKKVHSIIDKLNPNLRSIDNFKGQKRVREFYAMSPDDAYSLLEAIAEINDLAGSSYKQVSISAFSTEQWNANYSKAFSSLL